MKFYVSYFYNIRFFPKNLIPVSTAVYDPKWYHMNQDNSTIYVDKRGVINGVRCKGLSPYKVNSPCKDCDKRGAVEGTCSFLKEYKAYLDSLDFSAVKNVLEHETAKLRKDCDICLIVHEAPDNPCSERLPLMQWFKENGIELEEWTK